MLLLLLLLHRLINAHHFPLTKNGQNSILFHGEIFPENFRRIGFFLTIVFWQNLTQIFPQNSRKIGQFCCKCVSENTTKFWLFFCDLQRPCFMDGLRSKSSWPGHFFLSLSPPNFFPSQMSIMSNLDQSYLKKVKVWITLEA